MKRERLQESIGKGYKLLRKFPLPDLQTSQRFLSLFFFQEILA